MSIFENHLRGVRRAGFLLCAGGLLLSADTLTLRNGATVQGVYLGGTAREVRMDQNGSVRTYDIGQVQSVIFSEPVRESAPPPPPPPPPQASYPPPRTPRDIASDRGSDRPRDNDRPPQQAGLTIPIDTPVTIRMIDAVNSDTSRLGETFRASLDEPVVVDGQEVIPRGADVLTKLVQDQQSGKIQGRTVLTLALSTITVNGRPLDVTSTDVKTESSSRGGRSGKVIGGTAALGAIIGAIAGGGKGAAIGAGSGAAVGTGAEVLTGGQKVKIPSETRLTFRLQNPVQL
ncbi:MAG TPA: hypothetical protein VHZ74_02155 [Bryobacteraceae bacterium]|jgi:hypothetical protein|nr:hypothetical protein [Bryobacteraceae bacterium]